METQFCLLQSIRLKIFEMQLHPIIGIAVADSIDLILQNQVDLLPISIIDILVFDKVLFGTSIRW